MNLVCSKLLCAIAAPYEYETVTAVFSCAGNEFTAKGKTRNNLPALLSECHHF
jgi:DNA topoisomerase-3